MCLTHLGTCSNLPITKTHTEILSENSQDTQCNYYDSCVKLRSEKKVVQVAVLGKDSSTLCTCREMLLEL
jgi:hypothetical protein